MYKTKVVSDMAADFENTFSVCEEVTDRYKGGRSMVLRIGQCMLRLLAPLF